LMVALSLLPVGLLQAHASVETGLWYARSSEFLQQPLIEALRWLRIVGDTIFMSGVAAFAWFVLGLWTGGSVVAPLASPAPSAATPRIGLEREDQPVMV